MEIEPAPAASSHPRNIVLFNDRGLRAGWRLLIYIALLAFLIVVVLFPLALKTQPEAIKHGILTPAQALGEGVGFLLFLFAAFIMSLIEKSNMGEYGLPIKRTPVLRRFFTGYVFWGFLPLSVCLLIMRLFHAYSFGSLELHGTSILIWGIEWGVVFLFVGLSEEYLLRGYALYTLAEGIGFWPAVIVLAVLFGIGHSGNPGETRIGLISVVAFALFASTALKYTGNLWLAVGAHAGWDWGQSFFYGVSDSGLRAQGRLLAPTFSGPAWLTGGSVGPEGSVIALILLGIMTGAILVFYRRRPELVVAESKI
ncbi:MAG TPA: type II CAAX endopeptidase family protein [Candidatus Angelobacter sp.]|nr:type II CAAX endopeptidase family protein [Candidatus Angelobacter sp.]